VRQSDDGKWNKFGGRLAWDKSAISCNNPAFGGTGSAKTGEDYVAAPNIDHTQVRCELHIVRICIGMQCRTIWLQPCSGHARDMSTGNIFALYAS